MVNYLISVIAVIILSVERVSLFGLKGDTTLLPIICQSFICLQAPRQLQLQLLLTKLKWAEK